MDIDVLEYCCLSTLHSVRLSAYYFTPSEMFMIQH